MLHPRPRRGFAHGLGWLFRFPRTLLATWALKRKCRALGDDAYLDHQRAFFGMDEPEDAPDKFSGIRRRVAAYARAGGHASALDVATGLGFQAAALRDQGFERVVAVDVAPERVKYSRRRFPQGIEFSVMDATRLDFTDASFDCATVSAALHDLPPAARRRAVAELARVTRHTVVLFEPRTLRNPILAFVYGTVGSWLDESLHFLDYVRHDLHGLLAEHGLDVVRTETVWFGLMTITVCRRAAARSV